MGEVLIEGDDGFPWVVDTEGVTMAIGVTRSFVYVVLVWPLAGRARARFFQMYHTPYLHGGQQGVQIKRSPGLHPVQQVNLRVQVLKVANNSQGS